jgi:hypothetical protein
MFCPNIGQSVSDGEAAVAKVAAAISTAIARLIVDSLHTPFLVPLKTVFKFHP